MYIAVKDVMGQPIIGRSWATVLNAFEKSKNTMSIWFYCHEVLSIQKRRMEL